MDVGYDRKKEPIELFMFLTVASFPMYSSGAPSDARPIS